MLVIESPAAHLHHPRWRLELGSTVYQTDDVPQRAEVIRRALESANGYRFQTARQTDGREIARLHPYYDFLREVSRQAARDGTWSYADSFSPPAIPPPARGNPNLLGYYATDSATPVGGETFQAARGSAAAAMEGGGLVAAGQERVVYTLCRPPGHHSGPRGFGGYCYFNNAALAAERLRENGPVAILDLDFHHGNGPQDFFSDTADIYTVSIHADPTEEYPYFSGYEGDPGQALRNFPLPLGAHAETYFRTLDAALESIGEFGAESLVLATGFDTHFDDPLGGFALGEEDYREIGRRCGDAGLPTVIVQEGGYNVSKLGACVANFLEGFSEGT